MANSQERKHLTSSTPYVGLNASRVVHMTPETEKAFIPTHTVKAKLNIRSSSSLNATPIAVLEAGSEVEYISEADGWYYVNTQFRGKGWCSSDYLSPPCCQLNKKHRLIDL